MRIRVAGLLIREGSLLLVKHCKGKKEYWLLPGGGVETGEYIKDALKREIKEELGIDIKVKDLLYVFEVMGGKKNIIQPTYLVECNDYNFRESEDKRVCGYRFFRKEQLNELVIYPDIKNELIDFLSENRKTNKRYILKRWI